MQRFFPTLDHLDLNNGEKEVVRRFKDNPQSRYFLPISDILRLHRYSDESIEMLIEGVSQNPRFTVARVILARELYQKGLMTEAWRVLEESPVSLLDNILAQKLRFKLAILLYQEATVKNILRNLQSQDVLDDEIYRLSEITETIGLEEARTQILKSFDEKNIKPVLGNKENFKHLPETKISPFPDIKNIPKNNETKNKPGGTFNPQQFDKSYHVVDLQEVFHPYGTLDQSGNEVSSNQPGTFELDTLTMADIYARQGFYHKARSIYQRLLDKSPTNEMLRSKLMDVIQLEKKSKGFITEGVNPGVAKNLMEAEAIDQKVRFLEGLMEKLNNL